MSEQRLYFSEVGPTDDGGWGAKGLHGFWVDRSEMRWPISMKERGRLALRHEPKASASPDGYRLATCVVCERPMVAMWHLWMDWTEVFELTPLRMVKEIHMCHACATDIYQAPTPPAIPGEVWDGLDADR